MSMMSDLKVFEKFNLQLRSPQDQEESKEQSSPNIDHLLSEENLTATEETPLIDEESILLNLDPKQKRKLLRKWFDNKLLTLKLLYRGSSHQFSKQSFVQKCHFKGATLIVIKTDNGRLFGGFTNQSWGSGPGSYDYYSEDGGSWLFSFDKEIKLDVRPDKK